MNGRSRPIHGMVLAGDVDAVGGSVTSFEVRKSVFGFDRFGFGTYADGGVYRAVDRGRPVVTGAELTFLGELAETGHLTPAIDRTYPLAEIADAHRYVEAGHKRGNVVITIAGSR